jgi:hypothetical protein
MTPMELKLPWWLFVTADAIAQEQGLARTEYVRRAVAWRVRHDIERLRESDPSRYATFHQALNAQADDIRRQDPAVHDLLTRDLGQEHSPA